MISHSGRRRAKITKPTTNAASDHEYGSLLAACRETFAANSKSALFRTDADGLWELYLKNLPEGERQFHNCHCCRRFIQAYGNLVAIDEGGHATPAMWSPSVAGLYGLSFASMFHRVKAARVEGVFICKETAWGVPSTPPWTHLAVLPPAHLIFRERGDNAGQEMAKKKHNFITVSTALAEFTAPMLDQALRLFEADALARSEKFVAPVRWLRGMYDRPKGRLGENVLWRAIAAAPDGYCHPRSSVIAPLLEDIRAGKPFAEINRNFESMLHPLRYQRPQAAPAAGNIKAAEAIVEKLGFTPSLKRRFARLDEVPKVWEPCDAIGAAASGGVFAHVKPKDGPGAIKPVDLPELSTSAEKFIAKVAPMAERMEFLVPAHGDFTALLTAERADAPVIMKWGNPFSSYVYHMGSPALMWRLSPSHWTRVTALVRAPSMWGETPMPQFGDGYVIVLDGAVDTRDDSGNALFPETLVGELHGARATLEAYSRSAKIGGRDAASVCGYSLRKGRSEVRLRVFSNGAWTPYRVDRWD